MRSACCTRSRIPSRTFGTDSSTTSVILSLWRFQLARRRDVAGTSFQITAMKNTMMMVPMPNRSIASSHIGNSGSAHSMTILRS